MFPNNEITQEMFPFLEREIFPFDFSPDRVRGLLIHEVYANFACNVMKEKFVEFWKEFKGREWINDADGPALLSLETEMFNNSGIRSESDVESNVERKMAMLRSGDLNKFDVSMWNTIWMHSNFCKSCKLKSKYANFIAFLCHVRKQRNAMGHVRVIRKTASEYEALVDEFLELLNRFHHRHFHLNRFAMMRGPEVLSFVITKGIKDCFKEDGCEYHFYLYLHSIYFFSHGSYQSGRQ